MRKDALAGAAAGEEGFFVVVAGVGADDDGDAGFATADTEVGILHDHGEGRAGGVPDLGFLSESADGAEGFELGEVALLDAVDLGEVVECFVGEFGVGGVFEDAQEDGAGLLVAVLADGEDAAEEVGRGWRWTGLSSRRVP